MSFFLLILSFPLRVGSFFGLYQYLGCLFWILSVVLGALDDFLVVFSESSDRKCLSLASFCIKWGQNFDSFLKSMKPELMVLFLSIVLLFFDFSALVFTFLRQKFFFEIFRILRPHFSLFKSFCSANLFEKFFLVFFESSFFEVLLLFVLTQHFGVVFWLFLARVDTFFGFLVIFYWNQYFYWQKFFFLVFFLILTLFFGTGSVFFSFWFILASF